MVDINTLFVPGSKTYVVGALLINNRGEIGCIGSNPKAAILSSLSPAERIERFRSMAGQHGKVGRLLPK